jgi:hypothetical protein
MLILLTYNPISCTAFVRLHDMIYKLHRQRSLNLQNPASVKAPVFVRFLIGASHPPPLSCLPPLSKHNNE